MHASGWFTQAVIDAAPVAKIVKTDELVEDDCEDESAKEISGKNNKRAKNSDAKPKQGAVAKPTKNAAPAKQPVKK